MLKNQPFMMLDTGLFAEAFKEQLLAEIDNLDEQSGGVLIHSENFQALNLLQERYRGQVKCVYIDPPFNLGQNGDYLYRTDYKDSTWAALLFDRIKQARSILSRDGIFYLRCDNNGNYIARSLIDLIFGRDGFQYELCVQRIRKNVTGQGKISLPLANDSLFMAFNSEFSELADPYLKLKETRKAYWRRIDDSAGFRNPPERIIFGKTFFPYKQDAHFKYSQKSIDAMISEGRIMLTCKNRSCDYEHHAGEWIKCPRCGSEEATPKYLVQATDIKILDTNWMDIAGYASKTGFSTENAEPLLQRAIDVGSFKNELVADYFAGSGTTLAVSLKSQRRWIGVEMGKQFDDYILPRLKKVCREDNISYCFKYIRLESYEDTLNNLRLNQNLQFQESIATNTAHKQDYILHYFLEVETRGSLSLLNVEEFNDPSAYSLMVKKTGSDTLIPVNVDLVETFNWLIGLEVALLDKPRTYDAEFEREHDQELPEDQHTRLKVKRFKEDDNGSHWFRVIEGYIRRTAGSDADKEKVMVIWRKLTDDPEQDAAALEALLAKYRVNHADSEYDKIYINGPHGLSLSGQAKAKLLSLEETFMARMWEDTEGTMH